MKKCRELMMAAAVSAALGTSLAMAQDPTTPDFLRPTYSGDVIVEVMAPQSSDPISQESGSAKLTFMHVAEGRLQVTGLATINGRQALRFENLLAQKDDGSWSDGSLTIAPTGQMEMMVVNADHAITAAGKVDVWSLTLHLRNTRLDWTGADADTELDLAFTFQLESVAADPRPRAGGNDCTAVVWQPRAVANVYGGSMSTIMVPICMPER